MKRLSIRGLRQSVSHRLSNRREDHDSPDEGAAKLSRPLHRENNIRGISLSALGFRRNLVAHTINGAIQELQQLHASIFGLARKYSAMVRDAQSSALSLQRCFEEAPIRTTERISREFRICYRTIHKSYLTSFALIGQQLYEHIIQPQMRECASIIESVVEELQNLLEDPDTDMDQVNNLALRQITPAKSIHLELVDFINDWDMTLFMFLGNYRSLDDQHTVFTELSCIIRATAERNEAKQFRDSAEALLNIFWTNMCNYKEYLEWLEGVILSAPMDDYGIYKQYSNEGTPAHMFRVNYIRESIRLAFHPMQIALEVDTVKLDIIDATPIDYELRTLDALHVGETGDWQSRELLEYIMVYYFHMDADQLSHAGARSAIVHDIYEREFGSAFVQSLHNQDS